ncbi:MAG: rubrerythrin [Proteobacteria bacterium]|nr:rubrerythrin [Pseudomonadota bacterium]
MSFPFNADEILEMAEQIERNGARFYRRAVKGAVDPRNHRLLLDLAAKEEEHEKVFASMRVDLAREKSETAFFDPDGQAALYLRAMADGHVFDVKADPTQLFTGKETVEDILRVAMGMEKDSIVFYLGMKELVPERLGKSRIDGIIKEEMGHLASLGNELATLNQELC